MPDRGSIHRFTFSDAGVEVSNELPTREVNSGRLCWGSIERVIQISDGLVLVLRTRVRLLIPDHFLQPGDRARLVELLDRCLSEARGGSLQSATAGESVQPDEDDTLLRLEFCLTLKDAVEFWSERRTGDFRKAIRGLTWLILVIGALWLLVRFFGKGWSWPVLMVWLAVLGSVLVLLVLTLPWMVGWLAFRKFTILNRPVVVVFGSKGVYRQREAAWSHTVWGSFTSYEVTPSALGLFLGNESMIILPRRAFETPEAFAKAHLLVHRHVGKCRCGYALRGTVGGSVPGMRGGDYGGVRRTPELRCAQHPAWGSGEGGGCGGLSVGGVLAGEGGGNYIVGPL